MTGWVFEWKGSLIYEEKCRIFFSSAENILKEYIDQIA